MKHFTFQWQRASGHLSGTACESSPGIFGKCMLPILALVLFTLAQVNPVFGQCPTVVCSSPSNLGNFGVDGDLNANVPGTLTGIHDDWFGSSTLPGPGFGVIGTTAATSVPPGLSADDFKAELLATSSRNLTYVQRMAFPNITPRFITLSTGHLLLDAVAARDNHTAGNSVDSTAFASGTDKNGANPATWSLGITGVPQKNDLIDVGGHLRRAYNFGTNTPGPLLGYAFATTRNTSGDSHIDFEIFRTAPVVVGTTLTNTGPDGGHTTTKFVPGGSSLQQPGDVLVSIDYGNGGTNPCASVRVWVNPNNVDGNGMDTATYNALPVATRIYTFTGVFDGASSAAPFGYAEIRPKNGFTPGTCLFVSVTNSNTSPLGAPWGSLSAQNASFQTNLQPLQLVEVAIDFSAFGLDIDPLSGNCFNLFGSLLIKTRSSTSFTSEMKDFAGPFIFGNFQEVNANAGEDKNLACSVTSVILNGSSTTPGATYSWTVLAGSGGNIVSGANTATPTVNSAGTYILTVSNPSLATCVATDTVKVVGTPDITPPTVTCPPAVTRHCTDEIPAPPANLTEFVAQGGSASDISGVINISSTDGPLTGGLCGGTITRTFTIKDECNNATTCTQIITINDDISPLIVSGPASQTLGCNPTIPAADISLVSATDNCSGVTISALPDVTTGDCNRTLTRTYVATDGCGNTTNYVQTFTFKFDTVAPVIVHNTTGVVNGSTQDIGCNPTSADITAAFGTVSASDNCDASVLAPFMNSATTQNGCMRSRTRTWMGVDSCGNASVAFTRTLTWKVDTDAPVISLDGAQGSNPDLGCNPTAAQIEDALGTASVSDNCDNLSASPSTSGVSSNGCFRTQTRTFNATDLCGNNAAAVVRTVTWKVDTDAPVITPANANSDLGCNPTPSLIEAGLGTASVSDNCDILSASASTGQVISNGCIRSQTRTWNVSDACGNAAAPASVTVTWTEDLTPPVITANGTALALGCNPTAAQIEAALGTATASDACGSVTPTAITAPEVINGCFRSQTRSWNAMDACGNDAIVVSRTATWKVDLTAPVITLNGTQGANPNLGCNPTAVQIESALGTASATDDCDNVTANPTTSTVSNNGCFRTQTRTWNASDLCGNNATAVVRTVTWKVDLTAPVITLDGTQGANPNLGCNPTAAQIEAALGTASATDNCDNVTANPTTSTVTNNGCFRTQTRTWNASDLCGNNATAVVRTVTWKEDLINPVISHNAGVLNGDTTDLGCNPTWSAINAGLGTVSVSDNCDANLTAGVQNGSTVSAGCFRYRTRTWNATDDCGNNATTFQHTVRWTSDTIAPVITLSGTQGANPNLGCNPTAQQIEDALGTASVSDGCGSIGATPTTSTVSNNGCFRTQTRTWNVTDGCGNVATPVVRTVTWKVDLTAPVITLDGTQGANPNLGCNPTAAQIETALGTASATDNCDNVSAVPSTSTVSSNGCFRTQTRTFNAVDLCGNNAVAVVRTVTWKEDLTAPVISLNGTQGANPDLGCNPTAAQIESALGTASATDNCDNVTANPTTSTISSNGCFRTQTRTWNASDLCGNTASAVVRTVTWKVDVTAPVISLNGTQGANPNLGCNPTAQQIADALGSASVSDNCDNLNATANTSGVSSNGCFRTQTRTFNAVDLCGNNAVAVVRTVTWKVDVTAPVITLNGPQGANPDLGCNPTPQQIEDALGSASASDDCDNVTANPSTSSVSNNGCFRTQTRTWNATDLCGNNASSVTRTVTWKADLVAPVVSCNITGNITICAGSSVNISSTAADDCDGALSSTCSRSDGASLTDAFPVGVTTVTCSATDACGNTGNCSFTVTVLANPSCTVSAPASLPVCGSTGNLLSATASNATSYSWSVTTANAGATPWVITSGANSPTVTYTAGSGPATFTLTVTNSLNGTNCVNQCQVTFECINSRFCTYTQGYYGASGGTACSGQTTTQFVRSMLNGNPLITGANSNTLTVNTSDFVSPTFWFYKRMPGGGTNAVLNGSSTCPTPGTIPINNNGTFKNTLLSQTITLGLNLRVPGTGLGGLRITGKYLLTYASSGSGCTNNTASPVPGTALVKFIPGSVINYLGANNTVADLLNLANQALGGTLPAGAPGLSAISNAVAAFNEGFDECRFLGGFFSTNPLDTPLTGGVRLMDSSRDFNALAYPNPARDQVTIEFMLNGFDSEVALEVFDLNGRRVAVLYNEQAEGDVPYRTNLDAMGLLPGVYFYQLTTGKGVLTNKFSIIK